MRVATLQRDRASLLEQLMAMWSIGFLLHAISSTSLSRHSAQKTK
jgi:hypothetical protein